MIHGEKFLEMLDPGKALEALHQGKVLDVKAEGKLVGSYTNQASRLVGLYQTATRKAVESCLGHSEAAGREGQGLANEWVSTLAQANSELAGDVPANGREAAEGFGVPRPAKVAQAA